MNRSDLGLNFIYRLVVLTTRIDSFGKVVVGEDINH